MTTPNVSPIFTQYGDVQGSAVLTAAANDYTGQGANNTTLIFQDPLTNPNGGYIQRIRFKSLGTNVATVARIFINNGASSKAPVIAAVSGTPTGTPSGAGGTLQTGNFFAKIYAVDQYGSVTAASTETASVSVTGPTGSISWAWTAVTGASSYIITVGLATGQQQAKFTSTTNSYNQTVPGTPTFEGAVNVNNYFFGEVSLPATTAIATAATVDIDYPMNIALPVSSSIIVGLGTAVAAGWVASAIGGKY